MTTNSYRVYQEINAISGSTMLGVTDGSLSFSVSTLLSESRVCANALALSPCILGRGKLCLSRAEDCWVRRQLHCAGAEYLLCARNLGPPPPLKPELVQVTGWDFSWTHPFLLIYQVSCQ